MIASITFRHFRALRDAKLQLSPFNLVVGPNGSGKTSLLDALLRLRSLSKLPLREAINQDEKTVLNGPEIHFAFSTPFEHVEASLECENDTLCDFMSVLPLDETWPDLRTWLGRIRLFVFDHHAMAQPSHPRDGGELTTSGGNLAAVLQRLQRTSPEAFEKLQGNLCRILPEYSQLEISQARHDGAVGFAARLRGEGSLVGAENLSQGTLYLLGLLSIIHDPTPPSLACIEELDRGFHPRLLREVRDLLYQLSHPTGATALKAHVQVVATSHSPYLLDLFRDTPEEVVLSSKQGTRATFTRLNEIPGIEEILRDGGSLGDLWYSGILGAVPQEHPDHE